MKKGEIREKGEISWYDILHKMENFEKKWKTFERIWRVLRWEQLLKIFFYLAILSPPTISFPILKVSFPSLGHLWKTPSFPPSDFKSVNSRNELDKQSSTRIHLWREFKNIIQFWGWLKLDSCSLTLFLQHGGQQKQRVELRMFEYSLNKLIFFCRAP